MVYTFKIAKHDDEFEQIHRLNYQIFVEEIPQHAPNNEKKLVDPFHNENTYLICLKDEQLIGMIAVRDKRPFSLDKKIGQVEKWLPFTPNRMCEIRLLAVKKEYRKGRVFFGLAQLLARYCLKKGYDTAVISGTTRELKLYRQMGFQPFAYLVGTEDALYQPMYLTKETFKQSMAGRLLKETISFLPGPVRISSKVIKTLTEQPISHRSSEFVETMRLVQKDLCRITKARFVEIFLGTGTLANDVVAHQLKILGGKGIIFANGEFGQRLIDHAERAGLDFVVVEKNWGEPFFESEVKKAVSSSQFQWLWMVHCETSTGVLNDLKMFEEICQEHHIQLCVDCISSLGSVPLDLSNVYLASGVSGKGIGALTGLSFVFHNYPVKPSKVLPRYLDLGNYFENDSIPYSHSSPLLRALSIALTQVNEERYNQIQERYHWIRRQVEEMGLTILASLKDASPAIMTIVLPNQISSVEIGDELYMQGYELHYESNYLRKRNWLQIACIGDYTNNEIDHMLASLKRTLEHMKTPST
jgi:aspartate aminotransferase-like enzyme